MTLKLARRKFLGALAATPLAAKTAVEENAGHLMNAAIGGLRVQKLSGDVAGLAALPHDQASWDKTTDLYALGLDR